MTLNQYKRFNYNESLVNTGEPITQFKEIFQQAFKEIENPQAILDNLKYMLFLYRERLEDFLEYIKMFSFKKDFLLPFITAMDVFLSKTVIKNRLSRSPPRETLKTKIEILFFHHISKLFKLILYIEVAVFNIFYLPVILRFLFSLIGVYL